MRSRLIPALVASLLLASQASAADMDDLLVALKRARSWAARGEVQVTVLFPPRENPTRSARALPVVVFRPALLQKNFDALRVGNERLAGRDVARFDLTPRAGPAARWSLWVDQVWNVPLAFEERSADGTLARRAVFTRLSGEPGRIQAGVAATPPGLGRALAAAVPGVRLPAGFSAVGLKSRPSGALEVTLSDGVNVLALVLAPRGVKAAPGVASRKVGGAFVWLVGNLPQDALNAALAGVQRLDQASLGTFLENADSNP